MSTREIAAARDDAAHGTSTAPAAFAFPTSIFYEVGANRTVTARPMSTRWQRLASGGQIRFVRDHWHLTERYQHARVQALLRATRDTRQSTAHREQARGRLFSLLQLRLQPTSDTDSVAQLAAIDGAIEWNWAEFQRASPTKRR